MIFKRTKPPKVRISWALEFPTVGPTPLADEATAWLNVERFFEKPQPLNE